MNKLQYVGKFFQFIDILMDNFPFFKKKQFFLDFRKFGKVQKYAFVGGSGGGLLKLANLLKTVEKSMETCNFSKIVINYERFILFSEANLNKNQDQFDGLLKIFSNSVRNQETYGQIFARLGKNQLRAEIFEFTYENPYGKLILTDFYPICLDICHFDSWKITSFFYNNFFGFGWDIPPTPAPAPNQGAIVKFASVGDPLMNHNYHRISNCLFLQNFCNKRL